MSKYVVFQTYKHIAIPAKYAHMLDEIKFVTSGWDNEKKEVTRTWADDEEPELHLVNSSEIKQPALKEPPPGAIVPAPRPFNSDDEMPI